MTNATDRRAFERFPIEVPVELRFKRLQLDEKTVNIGSGGLLMTCSCEDLKVGMYVKVCISWPVMKDETTPVLVRRGRIVRRESGRIAIHWKRSKSLTLTSPDLSPPRRLTPR
jgi:hypothetical protein